MRLTSIVLDGREQAAVVLPAGLAPVAHINSQLNKSWPTDMLALIERHRQRARARRGSRNTDHRSEQCQSRAAVSPPTQDLGYRFELSRSR